MSLKENINMVKEELNSEEKFFEKAVITEKFVKKYKNIMIGTLVVIVVAVSANIAYEANNKSKITAANKAFNILMKNPLNTDASAQLENLSPELYDVWVYSNAMANKDLEALKKISKSDTIIVNDLATYELAQHSNKLKELDKYASNDNAIYSDLALVESSIILMNDGKVDLAHQKLQSISESSSLSKVAKALLHYGVK